MRCQSAGSEVALAGDQAMEDAVKNTASLTTVFFEAGFLCLNLAVLDLALSDVHLFT